MALKVNDVGLQRMLDKMMSGYAALTCHLYQNNYTPSPSDVLAAFVEANFPGYAAANIGTWPGSTVVSSVATSTAGQITFTRSTSGTAQAVYGYYVLDAGGFVLWAERDPNAPVNLVNSGDAYLITPKFSYQSLY